MMTNYSQEEKVVAAIAIFKMKSAVDCGMDWRRAPLEYLWAEMIFEEDADEEDE